MATLLSKKEKQLNIQIGAQLRQQRQLLGLTQDYVGKSLGISYQKIQKYEKGANAITAARLYVLSTILQFDITHMFNSQTPSEDERLLAHYFHHMSEKEQAYILSIACTFCDI